LINDVCLAGWQSSPELRDDRLQTQKLSPLPDLVVTAGQTDEACTADHLDSWKQGRSFETAFGQIVANCKDLDSFTYQPD
jgi:hypothetical protein